MFVKNRRRRIEDEVFGVMLFEEGVWTHLPRRRRSGFRFLVTVRAAESGPSDAQREQFVQIRGAIREIEEDAKRFVVQKGGALDSAGLWICGIEIGGDEECRAKRFVVEISDWEEVHRVTFEGGRAARYGYDDSRSARGMVNRMEAV